MQDTVEQYRGFTLTVSPVKDNDDLWDFNYRITRADGSGEPRSRSQSAGGHANAEIAAVAGLEVARIEVDNLLALTAQ
ncbi:MAG: hypothetical protein ABIT83_25050 [Massilia sp.]